MSWRKIFVVAEFELSQTARRLGFITMTFMLPLFLVFIFFLSHKSATYARSKLETQFKQGKKILVEDRSGQFQFTDDGPFKAVDGIQDYREDLLNGESIGYLIIQTDYLQTSDIDLIVLKNKALGASQSFRSPTTKMLRQRLLADIEGEERRERIFDTVKFKLHVIGQDGDVQAFDYHQMVIPVLFLVIFMLSVTTASTFLLQSVSEEKENRTIEILLSTIRDAELIAGKVIGLGTAALIQVGIWIGLAAMGLGAIAQRLQIPLEISRIPLDHILVGIFSLLIGFMIFAAFMIGVGALAPNYKDAQQYSSIFIIGSILPLYVMQIILEDIHGTLAVFLYYFPLTSPLVLVTRFCLGNLSLGEVAMGFGVLLFFTLLSVFLAARFFRLGCLMYNRRPSWNEIKRAL
tara:strand:- start:3118 stop:4332 length:1215 start_codon:yes stop_codon:yes gene_type:complete